MKKFRFLSTDIRLILFFCYSEATLRAKRQLYNLANLAICMTCSNDDNYNIVYEEQRHEFGYDDEVDVSNPFTCGSVPCDVTLTNTVSRADTYTKTVKIAWSTDLTGKISDAISSKLGFSGDVSWSWSNTDTHTAMTARKCTGLAGQRVTVTFKPRYQISEGVLHKRARPSCKSKCNTKDKPSEAYKIKTYGKRNGYLVGEEKCRTEGGSGQRGNGPSNNGQSNNRGSNCRGNAQWGHRYDQWCSTNCAMNNCSLIYCICS